MVVPPHGFVEGVFVEVLWDVERIKNEGRREGQRTIESVWWKGEVIEVKSEGGKVKARIRYDAIEGFEAQVGDVHVLALHMQVADESGTTQLRWRFFEASGDISYEVDANSHHDENALWKAPHHGDEGYDSRIISIEETIATLAGRFEHVERFALAQAEVFSRFVGSGSGADRRCERIFAVLRQKLATAVQKSLPNYRCRAEDKDSGTHFDYGCTGSLRAEVDCSIEEFEMVCRVVRSLSGTAHFSPCNIYSGSLATSITVAHILFDSLSGLCEALQITNNVDIMCIARQEKHTARRGNSDECAVRIAGAYIASNEAENTPVAVLVSRSIHTGCATTQVVDVLTRESREFDPRSVWYQHSLTKKTMSIQSLLEKVFQAETVSPLTSTSQNEMTERCSSLGCFALRWRALTVANPKLWSRKMSLPGDVGGLLEVEVPYVLFRGEKGVQEIYKLATEEFISNQLGRHGNQAGNLITQHTHMASAST